MREFKAEAIEMLSAGGRPVLLLRCHGILNATVWPDFLAVLGQAAQSGRHVVFDLSQVPYINSGALGELALLHHQMSERGMGCALCNVHPDCLFQINLTGLDRILPVFSDVAQALREFDGVHAPCLDMELLREQISPLKREGDLLGRGSILLGFRSEDPLLALLEEVISDNGGASCRGSTPAAARNALQTQTPWLAILDGRHPDYPELQRLTALTPQGSLCCRVCLGATRAGVVAFPPGCAETTGFSIPELAALARLEGRRRIYAEALLGRDIVIDLRSGEDACELGRVICERLALTAGMPREDADGFFFALREAVDNACTHGNQLDPARVVTIHYLCTTEEITVTVSDSGAGFAYQPWLTLGRTGNPLLQAQQHRVEGRRGGLGIMLMCRCCDDVTYLPPGNTIRLMKRLQPPA